MSSIGPFNINALTPAISAAGSLRNQADLDRVQANQADQKRNVDEVNLSTRGLDDSDDAEETHGQVADRDADGREAWQPPQRRPEEEEHGGGDKAQRKKPDDEGHSLDLEA